MIFWPRSSREEPHAGAGSTRAETRPPPPARRAGPHGRIETTLITTLLLLIAMTGLTADAGSVDEMRWAVHVTLAARFLDPAETEALITPFMVLYAVHDAIVKPMPAGPNTPSLAESWTASRDGLAYDFVLRKNARFHNGDPVTADDVKFSFDRYRGAAAKLLKDKVKDVQVVNPHLVRFILKEPWPDFMTFYGTSASGAAWVVPKKYVQQVGDDAFKKAPIGAGPYRVVSFTPGVELVMDAFEGYWRQRPGVKRLVMRSTPEETTRAAALKAGEVDIAFLLSGPVAEEIKRTPGFRLVAVPVPAPVWLELPDQWDPKSPWHDQRVRLAASYAIDRQAVNEAETLGLSRLTGSIIPRLFRFALPFNPPAYDSAKARKLLAEAGYPNGFDAGDFYPFPPYTSMGEALQGYLQAVGIRSRIRTMERAAFLTAWRERKLHGIIVGVSAAAGNAATRLEAYATRDGIYAYGSLPDVEDLFAQQGRELDPKRREALLHQLQKILHDRVIHVPIYEAAFLWGVGPRVEEPGANLIPGFSYSAPFEDLRLKK